MAVSEKTYRRAEGVSLIGLAVQIVGTLVIFLLALANYAPSVFAASWHWLGGIPIWVVLLLVFHQKRLEALEQLELDELRRQREGAGQSALFEVEAEDLLVAGRRLRAILRYVLPGVTIGLAVYHIAIGMWLWRQAHLLAPLDGDSAVRPIENLRSSMVVLAVFVFASFVISRLVMGLAKDASCRMLRAGGNYLTGNSFVMLVLLGMLGLYDLGFRKPELLAAWVLPALLTLLGVEMVLNLILEMYRPRMAGSEPRPAIESRLLGLISEPGDVARSIADAMNYQFGFEISKTWFYQLLQKALGPLVLFQLAALLGLSIFVVVEPGQRAVIERFGRIEDDHRAIEPGLHIKWPWPIERARIVNQERIHEVLLGTEADEHGNYHDAGDVVLWTQKHNHGHDEEYDILVAPPAYTMYRATGTRPALEGAEAEQSNVSVNLLRIVAVLRYRVNDPVQYLYNYANPDQVLTATMQEAFLQFAASRDSDQLMTAERQKVNEQLQVELTRRIQTMDPPLGIELVDAGLVGVHPPPTVAASYEEVGAGDLDYAQIVRQGNTYANMRLAQVAGSVWLATQLAEAIDQAGGLDAATKGADDPATEQARTRLAQLVSAAGGEVARTVNAAEAERTEREAEARAYVAEFRAKLPAYQNAPRLFTAAEHLDTLARLLGPIRKYVIAAPTQGRPFVVNFDLKDQEGIFGGASPTRGR